MDADDLRQQVAGLPGNGGGSHPVNEPRAAGDTGWHHPTRLRLAT